MWISLNQAGHPVKFEHNIAFFGPGFEKLEDFHDFCSEVKPNPVRYQLIIVRLCQEQHVADHFGHPVILFKAGIEDILKFLLRSILTQSDFSLRHQIGADATSEQSVLALSRGVDEIFGRVDLLVYSAGIAKAAFISDFQLGDFDRSLQVNLVGYFLCAREFSRLMIRDGIQGRIIQINSKSGKVGSKHNSGYSAAKFGGVGLTQSLALDLAEYGITVHSLMLGNLLKSPMFQSLLPQYATKLGIKPDQVEQYYIDKVPLKRGCDYQDVLNMLLFYASPKASYCTGQSINVTGGQVMF